MSLGEGSTVRETGFNVEYTSGPLYAGFAYAQQDQGAVGTATNSGDGTSLVLVAVRYNFGVIKPVVQYSRSELGPTGNLKNDFWLFGATAPVGPVVVKAGYGRFDPAGGNNLQQKFAIGVDYPLSKRTKLYADASFSKQKGLITGRPSRTTRSSRSATSTTSDHLPPRAGPVHFHAVAKRRFEAIRGWPLFLPRARTRGARPRPYLSPLQLA